MKVKFFGHNCFFLQGKSQSILIDPWLTDKGAFFGSWYQWPLNHHCKSNLISALKKQKNVFLYISHEHQDHFDIDTLNLLLPHISKCIIPKYHDSFLRDQLKLIGYNVIELNDLQRLFLSKNDFIELIIVDTGVNHDSTAIINLDDEVFVNQNDCKIFDRLSYLADTKVDYYSVQFSGATGHPVCFDMNDEKKKQISKKKAITKLTAVRNAIKIVNPKYYLPSAGPAIFPFLNEDLSFGKNNVFIHQPDLIKFLEKSKAKIVCLRPGEEFNKEINNSPVSPPTAIELSTLKTKVTCLFEEISKHDLDTDLLKEQVLLRLRQIENLKFDKCPLLIFDWGNEGLEINLNDGSVNDLNMSQYNWTDNYMCLKATPSYFALMANSKYRWQDISLSFRATIVREPDIFNTFINIFIFSDLSNIRAGFETTLDINEERIVVVNPHNGKNYEISRFCPHNGADLKHAEINLQGNLVCPRHSWQFDLDLGGRCKSAKATIEAKEIVNTTTLCEMVSARLLKIEK